LLELKFALVVVDDYAYLREGIRIYYQPRTCISTNSLTNENTRVYYPDFLIRDFKTKQASLVEIKPDNFDLIGLLEYRTKIANHFIRTNGYDWTFQTIYEREIVLSDRKQEKFESLIFMLNETAGNDAGFSQTKSTLHFPILKYPVDVPGNRSTIKMKINIGYLSGVGFCQNSNI
jgi:hypothetical protein